MILPHGRVLGAVRGTQQLPEGLKRPVLDAVDDGLAARRDAARAGARLAHKARRRNDEIHVERVSARRTLACRLHELAASCTSREPAAARRRQLIDRHAGLAQRCTRPSPREQTAVGFDGAREHPLPHATDVHDGAIVREQEALEVHMRQRPAHGCQDCGRPIGGGHRQHVTHDVAR